MSFPQSAAVIGLGLMGGSLAKDLSAGGTRVLGYDSRSGVAEAAVAAGDLSEVLEHSLGGLGGVEVVILATPVDTAVEIIRRIGPLLGADTIVTDVGSTKARLAAVAEEAGLAGRFVGSHPLAGDHRSGWSAARQGLYKGATIYISPTAASSAAALAGVESLWTAVGGNCSRISADEHDRLMAWISHLPQVVSSAVAASLADHGCTPSQLGPGGRDVTRLAASSPEMWTAISVTNDAALLTAVAAVRKRLESFEKALSAGDVEGIKSFFLEASNWSG